MRRGFVRLRRLLRGCRRTAASLAVLTGHERRLYLAAWRTLLVCALRLRFPRLLRGRALLCRSLERQRLGQRTAHSAESIARAARRARADQPLACLCLPAAIALLRLLSSHGIPAELAFGLRRDSAGLAGLAGHAWVVHDGRPLNDSTSFVSRYVRLVRSESEPRPA